MYPEGMTPLSHPNLYDLCVIGGGINGTGIARDAAGRGLKVLLVEQGDLAQATSSASTKIIHGGLRYLEFYDFRLVHESLHERDLLLRLAPHLIKPMQFVLPHDQGIRPYWMVRAGLFLYDLLGAGKNLPRSRGLNLTTHPAGQPLQDRLTRGFSYSDCWGDDARLVALNALGAHEKGARIETRTRCTGLVPSADGWTIRLHHLLSGAETQARSRVVVNAAGPWVRNLLDGNGLSDATTPGIRLVQGSHIVVPRLYAGDQTYMLQQPDGRIIFVIPYEGRFTQIGTTERDYDGDPLKAEITADETAYLIDAVNRSFKKQISAQDIVYGFSGVRPLIDDHHADARAVTRDYVLRVSDHDGAKLLSVFGGKITTFRRLSEQAVDRVAGLLGHSAPGWTAREALPGGDIAAMDDFLSAQMRRWPDLDPALLVRYARSYGTRMDTLLGDPGRDFGDGVHDSELRYLIASEFARTADDILWRRSKLGLHVSQATRTALADAVPALVKEITGYDPADLARH